MPCLVYLVLGIEPGVLSMMGKYSTSPEILLKANFLLNSNIPTWISKGLKKENVSYLIQAIAYILYSPSCSLNAWKMYVHTPGQICLQICKHSEGSVARSAFALNTSPAFKFLHYLCVTVKMNTT